VYAIPEHHVEGLFSSATASKRRRKLKLETRDPFTPCFINIMASEKNTPPTDRDLEAVPPAPPAPTGDGNDERGKDEAAAMVGEQGHAVDPAVVARAVRKIE
jgi:hypothetical protein